MLLTIKIIRIFIICSWCVFSFLIRWFIWMLLIIIRKFISFILWVFSDLRNRFIARKWKLGYEFGRFIEDLEYFVERLAILNGDLPVSCDSDSLVFNHYKHVSKGLDKTFFSFKTYSNYENKSLVSIIFNIVGLLSIVIFICGISCIH